MPSWFVVRNGAEQGPISSEQLRKLVIAGQVRPDDLVRREDISKPLRAGAVKGLFGNEAAKVGGRPDPAQVEAAMPADILPVQHAVLSATPLPAVSSTSATPENAGPSGTDTAEAQELETMAKGRLLTPRRLAIGGGSIGCLLVLGLAMNAFNGAGLGSRASSDKHVVADSGDGFAQQSTPASFDVSRQFFDEFPSSARSGKFVGKQIVVSGDMSSAVRQDDGSYAFHIKTDRRGVSAKCLFIGSEARKAQTSNERQFTISGKFSRILETGTLEFVDCEIIAEGKVVSSRGSDDLPALDQFVTQVRESGQSTSPKGLPIHVRDKYVLRQRLGEPTNVLNSYRDRKGTHEVHDYACRDGRVILSVTYDLAGAWIYDVSVRRDR